MNNLDTNSDAVVKDIFTTGSMRRRLQDIGIVRGTHVKCLLKSFTGDPAAYLIRNSVVAIRSEDAQNIIIEKLG